MQQKTCQNASHISDHQVSQFNNSDQKFYCSQCDYQLDKNNKKDQQKSLSLIMNAKYSIEQIDSSIFRLIYTGAISYNLKYIISGGPDQLLGIWKYKTNNIIKTIKLNNSIYSCKFTQDSQILYVGTYKKLYQFKANQFKKLCKLNLHNHFISNIYTISDTLILTSSFDKTIIKTDFQIKEQIFKIQAHNKEIFALDYNRRLTIIASGSYDKSIRLWNANNANLLIERQKAHHKYINQVLFIRENQLVSLDSIQNTVIWNINYRTEQLEQYQLINNSGYNISLVLQQQYIIATGKKSIKVYTIEGQLVTKFDHNVNDFYLFTTIQLDSLKAIFIQGECKKFSYYLNSLNIYLQSRIRLIQ